MRPIKVRFWVSFKLGIFSGLIIWKLSRIQKNVASNLVLKGLFLYTANSVKVVLPKA